MKNKIRVYLLAGLFILSCLSCIGCGANEEALFLEAESSAEMENASSETASLDSYTENIGESGSDLGVEKMHADSAVTGITKSSVEMAQEEKKYIVIHVCGAVFTPGVYELEADSRVMDAVAAAGGFLPEADTEYVNLATVLVDGNKVRIPTKDETTQMSEDKSGSSDNGVTIAQGQENTEQSTCPVVNINTADKELLCTLPGIGETRAESILTFRTENGAFSKIEDIMQVSGIKENCFQKIKNYITVN